MIKPPPIPRSSHDFEGDIVAIESIEAVPTILEVVCRTTGMGFAAVARVTEDRWVACSVRDNIAFGLQPGGELKVETTICHEVRQAGDAIVVDHVADDVRYCNHPTPGLYGFQSYISMPILMPDGTFFGTLCAIDPRPAKLSTPETVGMFKLFAELIAFHLDAYQRIRASKDERDRLWQLSSDIMLRCDFEGRVLSVNPAWSKVLGRTAVDTIGSSLFDLIHPNDLEATRLGLRLSKDGQSHRRFDSRFLHQDGSYRWIAWSTVPDASAINAVGRDFTQEREQGEALATAEEALRQSQKMEAVGQLTGGVAHDFNNLLTIIRSSVDFLRRPDLSEDRRIRYMDAVSETVDRAAKLTGQLLAFARRQALKPEVFDLGQRLQAVAEMLDSVTGARIRVETRLRDSPCFVRADVSQFETALVNMAVNARDAMSGEGILTLELGCSGPMPPIRGHAGSKERFASISLTDTGSGIPPEALVRIFEPFFTTKEVGKGTGLGLSQVIGFAKQSGGDVDVESRPSQGTTFTLYLPEAEAEVQQPNIGTDQGLPSVPFGRRRVLVVEDNVDLGRFAVQILEDLGCEPEWAPNAEEALVRLGANGNGIDVVFSDVVMPGMGGIALAQELRARLPDIPVVLTSGYSHVLAQEGDHAFDLVCKPYSAEQLGRVLQHLTRHLSHADRL